MNSIRVPDPERPIRVGGLALHGLRARLVRGVGWNLVATVFTQGGTFALNLILANLWGVRVFGRYAIVLSTLTMLVTMAQAMVGTTATKYVAELRTKDPLRAGRLLGLCGEISCVLALVSALALLVGSRAIASRWLHAPDLSLALAIGSAVAGFNMMSAFLAGGLAGLESYRALGKAGVFSGILTVALASLAGWKWGMNGAIAGLGVSAACQWIVLFLSLRAECRNHGVPIVFREGWREAVLLKFVAPTALISLAASPAIWAANVFLVQTPDGDQQMAMFAAANSYRILVLFVPTIVSNVGMSLLNNQRGSARERQYRRVFWTNLTLNVCLVTITAAAVALLGPTLLGLFGKGFGPGYGVLLILMLAALPETISAATTQLLQSQERVWLSLTVVIIPSYGVLALGSRLLAPRLGAEGLAWSYVVAMIVAVLMAALVIGRLGIWRPSPHTSAADGR